jgi:hypothetical protein
MPKQQPPSPNDQRSNVKNPNNPSHKAARDNRANQLNPQHPAYKSSRGMSGNEDPGSRKGGTEGF